MCKTYAKDRIVNGDWETPRFGRSVPRPTDRM